MAPSISTFSSVFLVLLALYLNLIHHQVTSTLVTISPPSCAPINAADVDRMQFAMNLEYLEAEFFLYGATGRGLDSYAPGLSGGGPPPIGAQKALLLDPDVARICEEIGYQQIGNVRSIVQTVGGIKRPLIDVGRVNWGIIFNRALKTTLIPPFNPYANSLNFLLEHLQQLPQNFSKMGKQKLKSPKKI